MKRWIWLLLVMGMAVQLCSCQKQQPPVQAEEPAAVEQEPAEVELPEEPAEAPVEEVPVEEELPAEKPPVEVALPQTPTYDDSLLEECYGLQGSYTDSVNNTGDYILTLPRILADTEGARQINAELQEKVGVRIEEECWNMDNGCSLVMYSCVWKSIWHEEILTLVVQVDLSWDSTFYYIYHYDAAAGQRLTSEELLNRRGVDKEAYLRCLYATVETEFYSQFDMVNWDGVEEGSELDNIRDWTLSDEQLNLNTDLFFDENGTAYVIVEIGSMAGASSYTHCLALDWGQYES